MDIVAPRSSPSPLTFPDPVESNPSPIRYILSFILVSLAWGFTTPFIRRGAMTYKPSAAHLAAMENPNLGFVGRKVRKGFWTVVDLLRNPKYALPLLCNVTGSVWFFILVGHHGEFPMRISLIFSAMSFQCWHPVARKGELRALTWNKSELSLTVPIVNSLAFLFTVLGEWFAEGKIISRGEVAVNSPLFNGAC